MRKDLQKKKNLRREEVREVKPAFMANRVSLVSVHSIAYILSLDKVFPAIEVSSRI